MSVQRLGGVVALLLAMGGWSCDTIDIGPDGPRSVTIDPPTVSLLVGQSLDLRAATRDEFGVAFAAGSRVVWATDALNVAVVSTGGRVTAVGVGTATVTATAEGLTGSATITVLPAAAIGVNPSTLTFAGLEGSSDPVGQTVGIANVGGSSLGQITLGAAVYNTGEPTGWLSAALNAGLDSLLVRVRVGTLPAGTYQARLPVIAPAAGNSPQNVFVSFTVSAPVPSIALSPAFVNFAAFGGGIDPAPQIVTVTNSGNGNLTNLSAGPVRYAPGQPTGWLAVTLSGTAITLQASTGTLPAGTYLATVPVIAANAANSPQDIVVGFTVASAGPAIGFSPPTLSVNATEGAPNPSPDTVNVLNPGSGVLTGLSLGGIVYGSGQPAGWLSAGLTGTTAPAGLVLQVDVTGLAAGSYSADVPVLSSVATNSPRHLAVSLVVAGSDTVRFIAGGVTATAGSPVAPDPAVIVVDQFGAPIAGRIVMFSASGGGMTSQSADTTDTSGIASVAWTLGTVAGTNSDTLTANLVGGGTVRLVGSALAGMPTRLTLTTQPAGAVSNAVFTVQPAVQLQDAFGNDVARAGDMVSVAISQGPGLLVGTTSAVTDAAGRAAFTDLAVTDTDSLTGFGPHALTFSSGTLNPAVSATFTVGVSFVRNVQKVIQTAEGAASVCTTCHAGYTATTGLVNVATTFNPGCGTLVIPGDTVTSVLYRKVLAGTLPCGARMPPSDTLSTVRQQILRDWILQGANNN